MRNGNFVGSSLFSVLKTCVFSAALSLVCIALLSVICGWVDMSDGSLLAVSRVCKGLAIALSCVLFIRGDRGWLQGMAAGVLSAMLSYLVFSPMGGASLTFFSILELLFGGVVGMIGGIIAVNLRRE